MEVRVQKKKNKFPIDGKKLHTVWKVLAVILSICVLAGGIALWNRQEPALAGSFTMDKDSDNRYIFNIVEVVPETNQAILGFYIQGKENISKQKLETLLQTSEFYKEYDYNKFFYWEGKSNSTQNEPFTVVQGANGSKTLVNNEVFKLFMLGIGTFDPQKSIWENYQANKAALETFDKEFVINYKVVTPSGLEAMTKSEKDKINYLHIASGNQITGAQQLFGKAGMEKPKTSDNFKANNDISWDTALHLYYRAISENVRMSVSISSAPFRQGTPTSSNMFRLYQMLNYADDPADFKNWFEDGTSTNKNNFIDKNTGIIHENKNKHTDDWRDDNLNTLPRKDVGPNGGNFAWRSEDFIPPKWDNILIYRDDDQTGYLDFVAGRDNVEKILDFTDNKPSGGGNPPEEPEDGSVKVLEIEPSNSYWLSVPGNLPKLATAIGVDEDDISVTYVTPNTLNGMAVDLVAEYDLILIGDDESLLNSSGGGGSKRVKYRSNGFPDDAIIPQTLINGLLVNDYTTKEKFDIDITKKTSGVSLNTGSYPLTGSGSVNWNPLLREKWSKAPGEYFLKNVELSLELQALGADTTVSKARFSGDDVTQFMQKQLAEFVKSGQPVIITEQLSTDAEKQFNEFKWIDMENTPNNAEFHIDSRLLFALYGMEDVKDYYSKSPEESYFDKLILMDSKITNPTTKTVDLKKDFKSSISIKDSQLIKNEDDGIVPTIVQKGWNSDTRPELNTLAKSNTLTFDYTIEMPLGDRAENIIMKIIVDRNGDGYFDEEGDGASTSGKPGAHNNANASIKNDQVFTCRFADLSPNDYTVEGSRITGRYTTPIPVDSIEEICQFQVKVSTLDKKNPLYSVWTGYMRPDLKKKDVKVLQITPYSDTIGGKTLDKNPQFTRLIEEAEQNGSEYHFNFENGDFETISEGDFAAACAGGEIKSTTLSRYDLIVVGTDFSSELKGDIIDLDTQEAEKVLKSYSEELKKPIIFTGDAFSYVNSENYYAPEEVDYYYRNMTIEEGQKEKPTEADPNYRRIPISKEQFYDIKEKNQKEWDDNKHNIGEGTVYIDSDLHDEVEQAGTYKAVIRPINANDGRELTELYLGWKTYLISVYSGGREVPLGKDKAWVSISDFYNIFSKLIYRKYGWLIYYYTQEGYVTDEELKNLYEDSQGKIRTETIDGNTFNIKDLHTSLGSYETIPKEIVNEKEKVSIGGDDYYKFKMNGKDYLAVQTGENDVIVKKGYVWQKKVAGDSANPVETKYVLNNVAGKGDSLYPSQNAWNYLFTQKLRYTVGMDRFAITTDIKPKDKRDKGSSRRWTEIEELQGFTNGALLEYAFIPKEGSSYASLVNTASPYNTQLSLNLALGVKPRTEYIEPLNEGQIGLYPFKISDEVSEAKVKVAKNHAPYYQLDLERELGKGKIDDVTVWYTFAGSGKDDESKYFDTTVRDARNNYYLYSKGKIYYTGFSLYDVTEGTDSDDAQLVPDMEMKLFINTIYAALNSETEETTYYDTVVREGGTVSGIELAQDAGAPNRYTCYYDEYDETLELSFRVQKISAADGETTPLTIGKKGEKAENGLPAVNEFDETVYTLTGLPEENGVSNFPVVKIAGEQGTKGSMGSGASDIWYTLRFTGDKGDGKIPDDMDGMTMIIGPKAAETGTLRPDSIYAEIRFVKRNLFELD